MIYDSNCYSGMRWDDDGDGADGDDDVDDDPDDARSDDGDSGDDSPREGISPAGSLRQEDIFFSLSFPSRRGSGVILRSGSPIILGQGG